MELTRAKAAELLGAGPADAATLVAYACGMPVRPGAVAEHMAVALFAGHPEFARDAVTGLWKLMLLAPPVAVVDGPVDLDRLTYAVVDVESTGGLPDRGDRIIEVAIVQIRDGAIADVYESLVYPGRPIPYLVSRLTGITDAMVRDKPAFADIRDVVAERLDGHVFVAHNVKFDWRLLSAEMTQAGGGRLTMPRLCTVRLARRLLPHLRRRSLDHVAHHYDVAITGRHRAGGDAVATARCLLRMFRDAEAKDCATWGGLQSLLALPAPKRRRRPSALPTSVQHETTA